MISALTGSPHQNLLAAPLAGMARGMAQAAEAAGRIAQGEVTPENVVGQIQAEVLVKANAAVARTADEILGSLIDTTA